MARRTAPGRVAVIEHVEDPLTVQGRPHPNTLFLDLPAHAQPKPVVMLEAEARLEQLESEASQIHAQREQALEDENLPSFLAFNNRMQELPDLLAEVHAEVLAMEAEWLQSHLPALRAFIAPQIERQDELFAEQERINAELLLRQEVMSEAAGRIEDIFRRTRVARSRRQDVMRGRLARVASLKPPEMVPTKHGFVLSVKKDPAR